MKSQVLKVSAVPGTTGALGQDSGSPGSIPSTRLFLAKLLHVHFMQTVEG